MDIEGTRRKAEAGSCVAQTILGISYLYGYDVEVDYKEAFRLLSAAGTSRAVLNLGIMHAKGLGIPQNLPEAIRLLGAVAKPSDSSDAFAARIELGRLYSSGSGLSDTAKALTWYKAAIALAKDGDDSDGLHEARTYVAQANNGL
jgi:TPR repeat protein